MPTPIEVITDAIQQQENHFKEILRSLCDDLWHSNLALATLLPNMISESCDEAKAIIFKQFPAQLQVAVDLVEAMGERLKTFTENYWGGKYGVPSSTRSDAYRSHGSFSPNQPFSPNGDELKKGFEVAAP